MAVNLLHFTLLDSYLVAPVLFHSAPIVIVCIALRVLYLLYLHPLSDVPGPRLAAITDLWKTNIVRQEKFSSSLHKEHMKHGNVVRIGPNEVSIVSPEDVPKIYTRKTELLKGPFYDAWSYFGRSHFSDRNPDTHRRRRQVVAGAYSLNHLTSLEQYCDSCTEVLFARLDKMADGGIAFDLSRAMEQYAYECVGGIGFGKRLGLLESDDEHGTISALAQVTRSIVLLATLSSLSWLFVSGPTAWLIRTLFGGKGPGLFVKYASQYVRERQALKVNQPIVFEEGKDMLYRFMSLKDPETSLPLDDTVLLKSCLSLIVAGADTTKSAMLAFVRYVYSHPPTLTRLRQEIEEAISAGHLTFPISYAEASRLKFSWACLKEAMRLHPGVAMPLQRVVPPGGLVIGGRFYHAGTLVGMSALETHLDPRAYGDDASEWRPDRWLEGDRTELEKYNLTFGQGSRVCLGKNISMMEMSKLLPTIVYKYDIVIQNPKQPWRLSETWFTTQYEFFCSITSRI